MAIVADYRMSESAGSAVATDSGGGTAQNGTYEGGMSTDGAGSAVFDGVDDYIEIPSASVFELTEGTIHIDATLANPPSSAPYTLLSVDSTGFQSGGHLMIQVTGSGSVSIRHQTDSQSFNYDGGTITPGQAFSISYSFGPSGSELIVDGVTVDTGTQAHTMAGSTELVTIGASQMQATQGTADFLQNFWHGTIDRVVIDNFANAAPVCFHEDTLIETPSGQKRAGDIAAGDFVVTRDAGALPVLHACRSLIPAKRMSQRPNLRPIVIRAGALGNHADLTVTRQHCVLIEAGGEEVLLRAVHLARFGGEASAPLRKLEDVTVVHVLLDRHALIRANGAIVETLLPGAPVAKRVSPCAPHPAEPVRPCRPILSAAEAMAVLTGHAWSLPDLCGNPHHAKALHRDGRAEFFGMA